MPKVTNPCIDVVGDVGDVIVVAAGLPETAVQVPVPDADMITESITPGQLMYLSGPAD